MPIIPLLLCLAAVLALGLLERRARDAAWRSIPVRVHVNGTRGKSTVTRLIWSALREAGIPAAAKTTGTAPRLLLPDGREQPLARHAPASIREQLVFLRTARRQGARAVVVECMALDPELQWVSEHRMLRATIGVITNARPDHVEVMGHGTEAIASSLANTIPGGGVLVIGEAHPAFEERARLLGTRVVVADAGAHAGWLAEDRQVALAVMRELGVGDEVSIRGFDRVPHDPGAVRRGTWRTSGGTGTWIDATAANDPVSLGRLLHGAPPGRRIVVYNHRDDRSPRLLTFAEHPGAVAEAETLLVTGSPPAVTLWRRLRRRRAGRTTRFVPADRLAAWLAACPEPADLVFCGNTRGINVGRVLSEARRRG